MPLLDKVDISARTIAACNTISIDAHGQLECHNHDWAGIAGALRELKVDETKTSTGRTGLIIGAGGAARAATYSLWRDLGLDHIYIINRDEQEVLDLQRDVRAGIELTRRTVRIEHIRSPKDVAAIASPTYVVGTVPDFEPSSPEELNVKTMLGQILTQSTEKGILVDMCYKPRHTRHIAIDEKAGCNTLHRWRDVGHQAKHHWTAWAGEKVKDRLDEIEGKYWTALQEEAESNPIINPDRVVTCRSGDRL